MGVETAELGCFMARNQMRISLSVSGFKIDLLRLQSGKGNGNGIGNGIGIGIGNGSGTG